MIAIDSYQDRIKIRSHQDKIVSRQDRIKIRPYQDKKGGKADEKNRDSICCDNAT